MLLRMKELDKHMNEFKKHINLARGETVKRRLQTSKEAENDKPGIRIDSSGGIKNVDESGTSGSGQCGIPDNEAANGHENQEINETEQGETSKQAKRKHVTNDTSQVRHKKRVQKCLICGEF